jgi:hypothetical protein
MKIPNPLGCYRLGDAIFYSKLEAIEMHTKTGIHPHWDFNEAVYESYNWTVEPDIAITELYRQRAQQIRDSYDYVVLMYSGGADSFNVLNTFLSNDIKIDEIASFINYEATSDRDNYLNAEIFRVSIPTVEELKNKFTWLKHRILDLTQLTIGFFEQEQNKFNWIYELNSMFNPNAVSRESLPLKVKEWADIINSGKKFCILWGHDKPRISYHDGKFVFKFVDIVDNACTVKSIAGQQPYRDELFYWSPDCPKIVIKQAHLIKNYLNSGDVSKLPFVSTEKSDLAFKTVNGVKYWLNNHGVHSLIYPGWDINTFSLGKPASAIITPRDSWFFSIDNHHTIKYNYRVGMEKLWQLVPDYWKNNPADLSKGLKGCWSKEYIL